jgi:glycosyltransferase involved in cell wall biosynthesis
MTVATALPRFSVIMNVYNGETYLRAAIDSVLVQTFEDWELLIWDDCSTDGSKVLCQSYDDPRIRLFVGETNVGLGAARNLAIGATRASGLRSWTRTTFGHPTNSPVSRR